MSTPNLKAGENPTAVAAAEEHAKALLATGMAYEFAPQTIATRAFLDGFALGAANERERAAVAHASLIASNTTLRRERGEARAEVAQLKGALALGQENCDAEYEELRRERDVARDGLRDSAKFNGELQAEIVRLTVDRDNWSNQAQTELRELAAAQARVKELEELAEAKYAQGYSAANRLNTKRREVDQATYDELAALRAANAELETLLASEKATRNAIIAKGVATERANVELQKQEAESRRLFYAEQDKRQSAEYRIAELEAALRKIAAQKPEKPDYWTSCGQCDSNIEDAKDALARHAAGDPAKHPDTEPVRRFRIGLCQKCGEFLEHGHECDTARKEVQP